MKYSKILIFIFILFVLSSCQDSNWYPNADVAIENHFEHLSQTEAKSVTITFTIHTTQVERQ